MAACTSFGWASTVIREWGDKPSQRIGALFGLAVSLALLLFLMDYGLWRAGIQRPVRNGLWAAAILGPYAGLVAWTELQHPAWAHMISLASSLIVFVGFYHLDRWLDRRHRSAAS